VSEVPAKCPKCEARGFKETRIRVNKNGLFVDQKGTMLYQCGAVVRWEYQANSAIAQRALVTDCQREVRRV
jgi:predicted nucleic-acid-binding Zn-ribbon protein